MTDASTFDPIDSMVQSWISIAAAPQKLWQSFNNGWSFGNLTINSNNSSAPETEQAIVATESYGRQIGKLLDAVDILVARQADARSVDAFTEITTLKDKIDKVKHDMAVSRIDQLRNDLDLLRRSDTQADRQRYAQCMKALRRLLDELPPEAKSA